MEHNNNVLLAKFRNEIDSIDDQLLKILVKRFELVSLVGEHKKIYKIPIIQNHRIEYIINKARTVAEKNNLSPKFFEEIYHVIINMACKLEDEIIDK